METPSAPLDLRPAGPAPGSFVLAAAAIVVVALLAGLARSVLFLPGLLGMAAGAAAGHLCGRLESRRGRGWTFGGRIGFAAGAALLYGAFAVATTSAMRAGPLMEPLEWLIDVLDGYDGEPFFGVSSNSFQAVGGRLSGAWWLTFSGLDAALFGVLFLVLHGLGVPPEGEGQGTVRGTTAGIALGGLAAAGLVALHRWPPSSAGAAVSPASLQGRWQLDERAAFLGRSAAERVVVVTVSRADGVLRAGPPAPTPYVFTLTRRRSGTYRGRVLVRGHDILRARMRPAADGDELQLVVDGRDASGPVRRTIVARRLGP